MKKTIALLAVLAPAATACAESVTLTAVAGSYAQDFNGLAKGPPGPTSNTWTNDSTISGWYASRTYYYARDGSLNLSELYSYGFDGSSDRALGSSPDGSTGSIAWGVLLTNGGSTAIESLEISYVGEQWRNGSGSTSPQTIMFSYSTSATNVQTSGNFADTVASLNFTSPTFTGVNTALDGNASPNRTARSGSISGLNLSPNQSVFLQWLDINDPGTEHGLAVDDFSVTAQFAAVPVPLPPAAAGGAALFGLVALWRSRVRPRAKVAHP